MEFRRVLFRSDKQPEVMNGASEVFVAAFGDHGRHARAAVGTSVLPIPVEVVIVAKVKGNST